MGGGIDIHHCQDVAIAGNQVLDNRATSHESQTGWGGGIAVHEWGATGTVEGNWIEGNRDNGSGYGYGAGIYQWYGSFTYVRNHVVGNHGWQAVFLGHADAQFDLNQAVGNSTSTGIHLYNGGDDQVRLISNVVAQSGSDTIQASAYDEAPLDARLIHNTLVGSGSGNGVFVSTAYVTLALTNTIVANNAWGITSTFPASSTVYADHTLFWANSEDGSRGTNPVDGDPAFVDSGGGDYHLSGSSAAVDAGVEAGVGNDIDDDTRPLGSAPDIGADEARLIFVPLVLRGV
jgi:hypothetical protein